MPLTRAWWRAARATRLLNEARFATEPLDDAALRRLGDLLEPLRAAADGAPGR